MFTLLEWFEGIVFSLRGVYRLLSLPGSTRNGGLHVVSLCLCLYAVRVRVVVKLEPSAE